MLESGNAGPAWLMHRRHACVLKHGQNRRSPPSSERSYDRLRGDDFPVGLETVKPRPCSLARLPSCAPSLVRAGRPCPSGRSERPDRH